MHLALSYLVRLCVAISPSVPGLAVTKSLLIARFDHAPPYPPPLPLGRRMLVAPFTPPAASSSLGHVDGCGHHLFESTAPFVRPPSPA